MCTSACMYVYIPGQVCVRECVHAQRHKVSVKRLTQWLSILLLLGIGIRTAPEAK